MSMTRKNRRLLIEAFSLLRIQAEEGERLARDLIPQDLGATTIERYGDLTRLQQHAKKFAETSAVILKSIEDAVGASAALDRVKYPRAKTLSATTVTVRHRP